MKLLKRLALILLWLVAIPVVTLTALFDIAVLLLDRLRLLLED
jgi:hypothetical protein